MTLERGTLLHKRYRIVEILGQGGMGSVYRAVDENLGVDVAVKENLFTTDEYARQFRLEAVILANLRHPNLPRVSDHFVIGDQGQYLVMDYIEGEDLRQRMERMGVLPQDDAILIGAAMCDALAYLHSRKPSILHRDIKPGNVKITSDGQIFLVDFGLAKVVQGSQITTTGARAMTPGYSPPEQYGTARTDARTDIYSLGATLYATLTGVIPEDGLARAMDNAQLTPLRKRNSKIYRKLAAAIEKAMAVDADERFQNSEEFKKALLASSSKTQRLDGITGSFSVPPPPEDDGLLAAEPVEQQAAELSPITGRSQVIPEENLPPSKVSKKKKRTGCWGGIVSLLFVLAISAFALFYFAPQLPFISLPGNNNSGTETALAFIEEATPSPIPTETVQPTPTYTETPTIIPSPTITMTPSLTPTPTATLMGGGVGQVAFASDRSGKAQLYLTNIDGSNLQLVADIPEGACQPDWSPDGLRLVFVSPCRAGQTNFMGSALYLIDADGKNLSQISTVPGGDFEPAWSPDGNRIAYTSIRDGHMQIYTYTLSDGSTTRLTQTANGVDTRSPAWSPFGDQIVFSMKRVGTFQIWTMTDTGEFQTQLVRSGQNFWDIQPAWSPDSKLVLFSQRRPSNALIITWLMSIDLENRGSTGNQLPGGPYPITDVDFSPDGFWLAFEGNNLEGSNADIFILNVAGGSRQRLTTDPGIDFDPTWRP